MGIAALNENYQSAAKPIVRHAIHDRILQKYSQNVQMLSTALRDWLELSNELDFAIAKLRSGDWRLRNDPSPFDVSHRGLIDMNLGVKALTPLYKNLSPEIRHCCERILEATDHLNTGSASSLSSALVSTLSTTHSLTQERITLVVKQEDIAIPAREWLHRLGYTDAEVLTAHQFMLKKDSAKKLLIVGLSADFSSAIFTSVFPSLGIELFSHDWIREQAAVECLFPDIAEVGFSVRILSTENRDADSQEQSNFMNYVDPTYEIEGKRLQKIANVTLAAIPRNVDEELVPCRAYLLANSEIVFLPIQEGTIDALDLHAPAGERVQRISISAVVADSVLLLRVGSSETEAIVSMANQLGGEEVSEYRLLQVQWKAALRQKVKLMGIERVKRDLQDLGIVNPWIGEWMHPTNIRPNSLANFSALLKYLGIEPDLTVTAMSHLRHLHQIAGMRFRKILKSKFENIQLSDFVKTGFLLVDMGEDVEVAKLGAFRVVSVGNDVLQVPESAVKQLQMLGSGAPRWRQ